MTSQLCAITQPRCPTPSAVYYVPGWVTAQQSEGLQSRPNQTLAFRYRQCFPGLSPQECDAQSRWQHQRQILTLAAFELGSGRVLEVSGAAEPGQVPDTSHALIYRCLKNRSCTATDPPGQLNSRRGQRRRNAIMPSTRDGCAASPIILTCHCKLQHH
jgi:hypothetical protein